MDRVVDKIAALGTPGLVLVAAMGLTGWAGAAALTTALAALGGPFGMLGGIALLGILSLIAKAISDHGFEQLFISIVNRLVEEGKSKQEIEKEISSYPISRELKLKVKDYLRRLA